MCNVQDKKKYFLFVSSKKQNKNIFARNLHCEHLKHSTNEQFAMKWYKYKLHYRSLFVSRCALSDCDDSNVEKKENLGLS